MRRKTASASCAVGRSFFQIAAGHLWDKLFVSSELKRLWVLANVLRLRTRTPRGEIKLLTLRTETKTKVAGSDYSGGRAIWLHNWTLIATFSCCQRGKGQRRSNDAEPSVVESDWILGLSILVRPWQTLSAAPEPRESLGQPTRWAA